MGSNCKIRIAWILLFPILFTIIQCKEEKIDFYRDFMQGHDVWRFPIIKPYQLITADCCKDWNFQNNDFNEIFSVDSINLDNNYILIYSYSDNWRILDIKNKEAIKLNNRKEFMDFIKEKGLTTRLYSTEAVYNSWRETGQLPWAEEILHTQRGN